MMKMKTKVLLLVLALMTAVSFCFSASAAASVSMTVEVEGDIIPGATVVATAYITGDGVKAMAISPEYDDTVLELQSGVWAELFLDEDEKCIWSNFHKNNKLTYFEKIPGCKFFRRTFNQNNPLILDCSEEDAISIIQRLPL